MTRDELVAVIQGIAPVVKEFVTAQVKEQLDQRGMTDTEAEVITKFADDLISRLSALEPAYG